MSRRIEEQTTYAADIKGEWEPAFEQPSGIRYMRDSDVRTYVRETNARLKSEGSRTRIRSVEADDE